MTLTFRFAVASIFLVAGLAKLARRRDVEAAVAGYALLPAVVVPIAAMILGPFEVAAGLLLALGVGMRLVAGALVLALLAFSAAVVVNLVRGREIDCGCFNAAMPTRITWLTVVRNGVLIAMAALVAYRPPGALSVVSAHSTISDADAIAVLLASTIALEGVGLALAASRVARAMRPAAS